MQRGKVKEKEPRSSFKTLQWVYEALHISPELKAESDVKFTAGL